MSAAEVLTALALQGVELRMKRGQLCSRPRLRDRPELLALVKSHAAELTQLLSSAYPEAAEERPTVVQRHDELPRGEIERAAGLIMADPTPKHWRGEGLDLGDLRPCLWCGNLARSGRCMAATRGELRAARDYSPSMPDLPQRCISYLPAADDPDQRPGLERWPELVVTQARQHEQRPVRCSVREVA
jgi:hypothetical protein